VAHSSRARSPRRRVRIGLNASVFTNDVNRARQVAARLRSGTVGHNAMRTDFGVSFGGYENTTL